MHEDPQDMFREMDKIFAHLVTRMTRDFTDTEPLAFGYHMVIQHGGDPSQVPDSKDTRRRASSEPVAEVHHIGEEVKVITELPGATIDAIELEILGSTLSINADGGNLRYHTTTVLPPVNPDSMQTSFKNGVLELTFRILPGKS